ncbi:MAG: alpha-galactosidase [Armatimonadetes bacterium]|nr:alpha-galactosidase [Armatimonadota bacterium]
MAKITMIGAGSFFCQRLLVDIMSYPELRESTIALVDINPDHLEPATRYARRVVELHGTGAKILSDTDRRAVMEGSDFVIVSIAVGGPAYSGPLFHADKMIPKKYGVDQSVADTLAPGGIFRTLRVAPELLAIARDMEELCPGALMINYTNPMATLCWAIDKATSIKTVGLCHSVQGTSKQLAGYIGAPPEEIAYWVAGINHMSWFLDFKWNGEDAYPLLRQAMEDPEIYAKDTVRFEMFRHFDYFVTESTRHMSEYVPYFRKRPDIMEPLGLEFKEPNPEPVTRWSKEDSPLLRQAAGEEPINLKGSHEYASHIIHSSVTGEPFRFNGNVPNRGLIDNLPEGCCVEVPCLVDNTGVHPCVVGELPGQLAGLNRSNIAVQQMTVEAVLEEDRRKAYYALALDPLTSAVCSLPEIEGMFEEMMSAQSDWMAYLK